MPTSLVSLPRTKPRKSCGFCSFSVAPRKIRKISAASSRQGLHELIVCRAVSNGSKDRLTRRGKKKRKKTKGRENRSVTTPGSPRCSPARESRTVVPQRDVVVSRLRIPRAQNLFRFLLERFASSGDARSNFSAASRTHYRWIAPFGSTHAVGAPPHLENHQPKRPCRQ